MLHSEFILFLCFFLFFFPHTTFLPQQDKRAAAMRYRLPIHRTDRDGGRERERQRGKKKWFRSHYTSMVCSWSDTDYDSFRRLPCPSPVYLPSSLFLPFFDYGQIQTGHRVPSLDRGEWWKEQDSYLFTHRQNGEVTGKGEREKVVFCCSTSCSVFGIFGISARAWLKQSDGVQTQLSTQVFCLAVYSSTHRMCPNQECQRTRCTAYYRNEDDSIHTPIHT